jgi:preprotein translocase subunit YajC
VGSDIFNQEVFYMRIFLASLLVLIGSVAQAADEAAPAQGGSMGPILFLVVILAFMYFLVWRPQQRRTKEHRSLVSGVVTGDEIVVSGGVVGKINNVYDNYVEVEVSENSVITVQRGSIASVLPKGTIKSIKG